MIEFTGLFIMLVGFVVGLGAVTVIDLLGFLGQKSEYWTEATIRSHKVTKPLIWLGILLATLGGFLFYFARSEEFFWVPMVHLLIAVILVLNGFLLSFKVSPFLIKREKEGKSSELLPRSWQRKIVLSFAVSFAGWWSALLLLVWYIL